MSTGGIAMWIIGPDGLIHVVDTGYGNARCARTRVCKVCMPLALAAARRFLRDLEGVHAAKRSRRARGKR